MSTPREPADRSAAARGTALTWRAARAGIATSLLLGTGAGAIALLVMRGALALELPPGIVQAHAALQLQGFVLPVVIGVAPRLLPPTPWPWLARIEPALPPLALGGALARAAGHLGVPWAGLAGAALLALASIGIAATIASGILRRPFARLEAPDHLALAAMAALLAAAGLDGAAAIEAARGGAAHATLSWRAHATFLDGFVGALTAAVLHRMGRHVTGGARAPAPLDRAALLVPLSAALPAGVAGPAFALGAAAVSIPLLLPRAAGREAPRDRASATLVRGALAWLVVSAALRLYAAQGGGFLAADAARHAYTIGFLTLLILGMLTRLSGALLRRTPAPSALRSTGVALLHVGVALRAAQVLASPAPWILEVAAWSSVPVLAGVALVASSIPALRRTPEEGPR